MIESPRYAPKRSFPDYAFIPGQSPHLRPGGQDANSPPAPLTAVNWREHTEYLWGVDLYNHGYPWEAHEAWEGLWQVARRGSPEHMLLQGLIQCAAAVVKARSGQRAGFAKLAAGAMDYLGAVAKAVGPRFLGVDLSGFMTEFHEYAATNAEWPRITLA